MALYDVNLLAVFLAAVASIIIGAFWYSPMGFGNAWMKLSGFKEKDMKKAKQKGMAKSYFITFIGSLVTAYVLAIFVANLSLQGAMQTGFWIWLGFIASTTLGVVLWEGKPWGLYFINAVYYLVSIEIMSLILISF